jgi:hypothetical protein
LLASVCDLKGAGGSLTNLQHVSVGQGNIRGGPSVCVPDGQGNYGPRQPWLEGAVADAQQQRRRVVEAPFVRAAQIAVLDLVRQQVKRIHALEQRGRCRVRRQGGTGRSVVEAAEAARHADVLTAEQRLWGRRTANYRACRRTASVCVSGAWRRVCSAAVAGPWSLGLAVNCTRARRRVRALATCLALAPLTWQPVLVVVAPLLRRPTRDTGNGIAHLALGGRIELRIAGISWLLPVLAASPARGRGPCVGPSAMPRRQLQRRFTARPHHDTYSDLIPFVLFLASDTPTNGLALLVPSGLPVQSRI